MAYNPTRIIRLKEVIFRTGYSVSAIYRFIQEGTFPRQVKLGPRQVGWVESEIEDWIQARIAASRGAA